MPRQPQPVSGLQVSPSNHLPIFSYHSIGGPEPSTLSLDLFRRQLDTLSEEGFETLRFGDLFEPDGTVRPLEPSVRYAVLTFDDGLLDNHSNALPELLARGMTATFFVVPDFDTRLRYVNPATGRWCVGERAGYTIPHRSMGPEHRREMVAAGMEIGCHSMTHPRLTQVSPEALVWEVTMSKKRLEEELGRSVDTFCYPYGRYNTRVVDVVRRAGYRSAAATWPGYAQRTERTRYRCRRFLVHNPDYFREILRGRAFSPLAFVRSARSFGQWRFFQ